MKNGSGEIPFNFSQKRCKTCQQLKDKTEFPENSDQCNRCWTKANQEYIYTHAPFTKFSQKNAPNDIFTESLERDLPYSNVESNIQKLCVHCNELKNKSDFAISSTGESRICKACAKIYLPIEPESQQPPVSLLVFIAFIIGALLF
jgi:hypothetical protein